MKYVATVGAMLFLLGASAAAQNSPPAHPVQNGGMGVMQRHGSLPPPPTGKCFPDMKRFCSKIVPGSGRKLACLRSHVKELSPDCRTMLPSLKGPGQNQLPPSPKPPGKGPTPPK